MELLTPMVPTAPATYRSRHHFGGAGFRCGTLAFLAGVSALYGRGWLSLRRDFRACFLLSVAIIVYSAIPMMSGVVWPEVAILGDLVIAMVAIVIVAFGAQATVAEISPRPQSATAAVERRP
jgi:hypothetical protein